MKMFIEGLRHGLYSYFKSKETIRSPWVTDNILKMLLENNTYRQPFTIPPYNNTTVHDCN